MRLMKLPTDRFERCVLVNDHFDFIAQLLGEVLPQNDSAFRIGHALHASVDEEGELARQYADKLYDQFMMSKTLGDSKLIKRVLKEREESLDEEVRAIMRLWQKRPAFYLWFSLIEEVDRNMFLIKDLLTGEEHVLYSPGLRSMQNKAESRNAHYLTLMVDNDLCLQTAGMIHHNTLKISDMQYMAHAFDRQLFEREGLDAVIKRHPSLLRHYDRFSMFSSVRFGDESMLLLIGFVQGPLILPSPTWKREKRKHITQYRIGQSTEQMLNSWSTEARYERPEDAGIRIYQSGEKYTLLAYSQDDFNWLKTLIGHPNLEAQYQVSLPVALMLDHEGVTLGWAPFSFAEEDPDQIIEEDPQVSAFNEFAKGFYTAHNEGQPFDLNQWAKKTGLSLEQAQEIVETLEQQLKKYDYTPAEVERQYEIGDWPVPPPSRRRFFGDSLVSSKVFFIEDSLEHDDLFNAHTQGVHQEAVQEEGAMQFVEKVFVEHFDWNEQGYYILNTVLWMLFHHPSPVLVRSLALETVKLFPLLVETWEYETFVRIFSEAIIGAFVANGLCSVTARPRGENRRKGLYTIQSTTLLQTLVEVVPYSV